MYFEEIYNKIRPFWKDTYQLNLQIAGQAHVPEIAKDFENAYDKINYQNKGKYTVWDSMMLIVIYQTLTESALKNYQKGITVFNVNEIQLKTFERNYSKNLMYRGNESYLKQYKGSKLQRR